MEETSWSSFHSPFAREEYFLRASFSGKVPSIFFLYTLEVASKEWFAFEVREQRTKVPLLPKDTTFSWSVV